MVPSKPRNFSHLVLPGTTFLTYRPLLSKPRPPALPWAQFTSSDPSTIPAPKVIIKQETKRRAAEPWGMRWWTYILRNICSRHVTCVFFLLFFLNIYFFKHEIWRNLLKTYGWNACCFRGNHFWKQARYMLDLMPHYRITRSSQPPRLKKSKHIYIYLYIYISIYMLGMVCICIQPISIWFEQCAAATRICGFAMLCLCSPLSNTRHICVSSQGSAPS